MSPRQAEILTAIIETYARTAEPVGSVVLAESFNYSPATIRSEMAALEELGLIMQPHISAGRVPTDTGYRFYVNSLDESAADGRVSRAIAKRIQSAGEIDRAIKQAAESLAQVTGNVGWATLSSQLYYTGLANLFGQPEFFGGTAAYEAARLLDNLEDWSREVGNSGNRVSVLIGRENPVGKSSGCTLVVARFRSPFSDHSCIGVLGSTRQNYSQVIGLVDYTGRMLEEVLV